MNLTNRSLGLLSLAVVALVGRGLPAAHAAELAGIMPAETVLYLEWSGADAGREARAATALGKLLAEPEVQRFTAELHQGIDRLMVASGAGDELKQVAMGLRIAKPLLQHLWHHRIALSLIGTEMTDQGPSFAVALAIELGDDGDGFVTAFQGLINMATVRLPKQTETIGEHTFQRFDLPFFPPIRYGAVDDVFLVTMGADVASDILSIKGGAAPGLASNARLRAARTKLDSTPANTTLLAHLDVARMREQAKSFLLGHTGSEAFPPPVPMLLEELGVNSIKTVTYTGQLADGGYRNAAFIAIEGPPKGALKLFEARPLTDEDFHAIPADATLAKAANFDLPAVFDEAMRIATALAPEAATRINEQFEQLTSMKLREDVIALFDDGWAVFNAPSQGGLWFAGVTVVAETKDADAFMTMLDHVVGLVRKKAGDKSLSLKKYDHNGKPIHYASITAGPVPVAPAWGAHGNRVVLALFPQMVAQTLDRMAAPDVKRRCILGNPDFARGRKLLPPNCSSIAYNDTRLGAADLYKLLLPVATAGFSFAGANGVPLDISTIPTQGVMIRHLFGDVSGLGHDQDGFLFTSHGPLPLPIPSIGAGGSTASTAMIISVLLPSLSRARELSKRQVSVANLRGIGLACQMYAQEHEGQFPPDLETLVAAGNLTRKQLISPRDPSLSPAQASRGDCSYVYVAGQTQESNPRNVLAYEPDYDGEGGNVLFVDGHVEWIKPPRYQQVIDDTGRSLARVPRP